MKESYSKKICKFTKEHLKKFCFYFFFMFFFDLTVFLRARRKAFICVWCALNLMCSHAILFEYDFGIFFLFLIVLFLFRIMSAVSKAIIIKRKHAFATTLFYLRNGNRFVVEHLLVEDKF